MKKPRNLVYRLRTNKVESDLLQARAEAAGMKPTAYIRSLIFPKSAKKIVATKQSEIVATKLSEDGFTIGEPVKIVNNVATKAIKESRLVTQALKDGSYRRFAEPGSLLKK